MDGLFELIIFALFILTSVLGGRKKRKQGSKPKGRSPGDGRVPDRPRSRGPSTARERSSAGAADAAGERESAAAMVPEDLWAVLTGEQRTPSSTGSDGGADGADRGAPVPAGGAYESETAAEPERGARSTSSDPVRWDDEAQSLETIAEREQPRVVSLEERPLPPEVRRHLTLEQAKARADALPTVTRRRRRLPLGLNDRDAVRRAVVLREVLGPPKGLQP